jgi:hypothetical protein
LRRVAAILAQPGPQAHAKYEAAHKPKKKGVYKEK